MCPQFAEVEWGNWGFMGWFYVNMNYKRKMEINVKKKKKTIISILNINIVMHIANSKWIWRSERQWWVNAFLLDYSMKLQNSKIVSVSGT
jgi:hypothetical protein